MERKNRQGASELQRHDHDVDLPDGARAWVDISRKARAAATPANSIRYRHTEEGGAWGAAGDGRWQ